MTSPKVWTEIWKRPGHATYGRQISDPGIITASGSQPVNGVGEGRITLPAGYSRLDEIIKAARPTPSAAVSSTVRYFSESQTDPIFEWIPLEVSGLVDKNDSDIDVKGAGIDALLGYARVEAWDWTGIDDEKSMFPDWIWGGKEILGELTSAYDPAIIFVWTNADGGTFTLGVSVDGGAIQNTSAIAYNASAATVEAALEALSNVVDVAVTGSGTAASPWRIQTVDPEDDYTFSKDQSGLTGPWQVDVVGATSGTWTATVDGSGPTTGISHNANASTVKAAIEALASVTTCTVERFVIGNFAGFRWLIYFDNPDTVTTFTVGDSLSPAPATVTVTHLGGVVEFNLISVGNVIPAGGWTPSFNPVTNLPHGFLSLFTITNFAGTPAPPACLPAGGMGILFNGGLSDFPGVQKIVAVKPGGRYYASVWVWANAAETYRFVIRDLYENGIAADPGFTTGTTVTPSTWTQFFIPVIDIPLDVDRVIFRFASVDSSSPNPNTFIACMELREGMPPTTWGDIWTQLWLDATTDHAPTRVVWEAGTTNLPYLTLDFDAALDSAGNAWLDPEVSITLKRGQSYLRVRGEDAKMGYEGRIVADNYLTGTYKFQLYNKGTMDQRLDLVSNGVTIQGGRDVGRRDLRRFLPPATNIAVEAGGQNIARSEDASAVTALGRIEAYQPNQDLGSLVEAATVADQSVAVNLNKAQALSYVLMPTEDDPEPFVEYVAGDTLFVLDPPDVSPREARRIKKLGIAFDKNTVQYQIQLESESFVGVGAIYEGVNVLLKEFKAIRDQPPEPTDPLNYFTDPCCPSCPAIVEGFSTGVTTNTSLDWAIDNDPDQIVEVDGGGNLFLKTGGLYTIHFSLAFRFNLTTAGWTVWTVGCAVSNNDAGIAGQTVMAAQNGAVTMDVEANLFFNGHTQADGEAVNAFFQLVVEQSAGLVDTATGVIEGATLTIIRHGDGCARIQGSG